MMVGRFQEWGWLTLRDGRAFWGFLQETRVATAWFISVSYYKGGFAKAVYLSSEEIVSLTVCSEEACDAMSAALGDQPGDFEALLDHLKEVREAEEAEP